MIDILINALKLSLNECKKYEDPAEYIYQINQVLNRYKTNLFSSIKDHHKHLYDPKEFIQFRIAGNYRTNRQFPDQSIVVDRGPVMLYVNGFFPNEGERINKEKVYHKAVRIEDVVRPDFMHDLYNDQYRKHERDTSAAYTEQRQFEDKLGDGSGLCCVYFSQDLGQMDLKVYNFQINSMIYPSVLSKYNLESAKRMADGGPTRWGRTAEQRAADKAAEKPAKKPYKVKGGIKTCFLSSE